MSNLLEKLKDCRFPKKYLREDFLKDEHGLEKLDAICMQLIAIV